MSYFILCNGKGVVVFVCPSIPLFRLHVTAISTDKQENEAACINALKDGLSVLYALPTLT
jgi:hypothetical protein